MYKETSNLITQESTCLRHANFGCGLFKYWWWLTQSLVFCQLFVLLLLISEKEHKNIVYIYKTKPNNSSTTLKFWLRLAEVYKSISWTFGDFFNCLFTFYKRTPSRVIWVVIFQLFVFMIFSFLKIFTFFCGTLHE